MRTLCSREIFTKKRRQQQIFDLDLKGAWHYNHVTFTPIAKNFMLYCRLTYMLSILCVRLTIKVKVGIPESFKVGWYPRKKTGSSHFKVPPLLYLKRNTLYCEANSLVSAACIGKTVLVTFKGVKSKPRVWKAYQENTTRVLTALSGTYYIVIKITLNIVTHLFSAIKPQSLARM